MVASALRVFSAETRLHARGWCSAIGAAGVLPGARPGPVMTAGLRLTVDPIACDGRGLCAE